MFLSSLEISLYSLPFVIGMIGAFLASKRGAKSKTYSVSENVWHGYSVGNMACIFSSGIVSCMLFLFYGSASWSELIGVSLLIIMFTAMASFIVGLILYLPCAFMGANIAARKKAESKIERKRQQVIQDLQNEE